MISNAPQYLRCVPRAGRAKVGSLSLIDDRDRQARIVTNCARLGVGALLCILTVWIAVRFDVAGSLGIWLKYDYLTGPCVIGGAYYVVSRLRRVALGPAVWALVFGLCFLVLYGTWQAGVSDLSVIGGLLPYSDSAAYYSDALRLLHGQRFTDFSSRRPLFPTFFATLLFLTNGDLSLTLLAITALTTAAIAIVVRNVERDAGTVAAIFFSLCLFFFYRRYIGAVLTEHLGLMLGCVAFCLLWRGATSRHLGSALGGLFLLSLGLNARAGPFVVLPAIACWAAWEFRGPRRSAWWIFGGGAAAAALGFAINGFVLHAVGLPEAAFSNFSYVLYGLVYGGNWTTALHQHPELAGLPPLEQSARVYALAWEQIRAHPSSVVYGSLSAWRAFFVGRSCTWFSFLFHLSPEWLTLREMLLTEGWAAVSLRRDLLMLLSAAGRELWVIVMNVLLATGALVLARRPRSPLVRLHGAAWAGILLSVPFVPPWDTDNMRVYAAAIPILAGLPLMGLLYWRRNHTDDKDAPAAADPHQRAAIACAVLMVGALILGAIFVRNGARHRPADEPLSPDLAMCERTEAATLLSVDPRVAVHIVGPANGTRAVGTGHALDGPSLRRWDHARAYSFWHVWRGLSRLPDGTSLAVGYDIRYGRGVYLQLDSALLPPTRRTMVACGSVATDGWIERLVVTSLEPGRRQ